MAHILFVEDDTGLIQGLSFALSREGHDVTVASTKKEALLKWRETKAELVILDVTLPDGNGFDICEEIRKESNVPIIFLTARDDEMDITRGLDIGGDDYIAKPFKLSVLMSRIGAILRRCNLEAEKTAQLHSNGIIVNRIKGEVSKDGEKILLTSGEYKLLVYFIENSNRILSSEQILANLWDCDDKFVDGGTLTVYIRRLRQKIEDNPSNPTKIKTIRGMGYIWNDEVTK